METKRERVFRRYHWTVVDALYWVGAALISGGAGWLLPPAGLIAAGVFALAGAWLIDRAGTGIGGGSR